MHTRDIKALARACGFDLDALVREYDPELCAVIFITRPQNDLDHLYRDVLKDQIEGEEALRQLRLVEALQQARLRLPLSDEKKPAIATADVYTFNPSPPVCFAESAN